MLSYIFTILKRIFSPQMGNTVSTLPKEQLERLSTESGRKLITLVLKHFFSVSKSSIKMLHERFISLAKHRNNDTEELFMSQSDFEDIPELLKNPLGFRLIEAFFADAE